MNNIIPDADLQMKAERRRFLARQRARKNHRGELEEPKFIQKQKDLIEEGEQKQLLFKQNYFSGEIECGL